MWTDSHANQSTSNNNPLPVLHVTSTETVILSTRCETRKTCLL